MRHDVLEVISSAKDVTNLIVLTHNIDFVFIQCVVLPALRKCGSPTLTIFADLHCCEEVYESQAPVLSTLGVRYRVIPVSMKAGFRFHPKALLLSGMKKATLLVGSGNVTFGGWRENAEVWLRYDTDTDGTAAFAAFQGYLQRVLEICPHSQEQGAREAGEAFDGATREWAAKMEAPAHLLGRAGHGQSLLEQMKAKVGGKSADHLYVVTPFFDEDAEALKSLATELAVTSSTVLVQSGRTNLLATAADHLGPAFSLKSATFKHREKLGSNGEEQVREAFLHAKIYAVQSDDTAMVFAGSANCSRAALMIPGTGGNAELLASAAMPLMDFRRQFLEEIVIDDAALQLGLHQDTASKSLPQEFIRVNAARFDLGRIDVSFQCSVGMKVHGVLVDGKASGTIEQADNRLTLSSNQTRPRTIVLLGESAGKECRSLPHWIDDEAALRVSARGRSLAESINTCVRADRWNISTWTEVLAELYKHLEYMPRREFHPRTPSSQRKDGNGVVEFRWEDVFAQGYRFPVGSSFHGLSPTSDDRIGSLRSMLLRWYGISQPSTSNGDDVPASGAPKNGNLDQDEDDDPVDRPVPLRKTPSSIVKDLVTQKERERALRFVRQIADRLGDREFICERNPTLLAADLKVAALLLRAGIADGWLCEDDFFDATLRMWLPLFFSAEGDDHAGWLELRYLTDPNQEDFVNEISSADMSAALACWALSVPLTESSPGQAKFVLASALSAARLPWLWQTGSNDEIAKQVAEVFAHTTDTTNLDWSSIEDRWLTLIRRGYALSRLKTAMAGENLSQLAKRIKQMDVRAGELLWQGKYGFCVAENGCQREMKARCDIFLFQRGNSKKCFSGAFLIPLVGLLDIVGMQVVDENSRREILRMTEEVQGCLAPKNFQMSASGMTS
jgi:hypothetical protein